MRWLLRLILFWSVMTPLSYYFGLPYALQMLSQKAQAQSYDECQRNLVTQGLVGGASPALTAQQSEGYCHCMSDKLVLTQADLWDAMQHKTPAALNAFAQAEADRCGHELQQSLGSSSVEPAPAAETPKPTNEMMKL